MSVRNAFAQGAPRREELTDDYLARVETLLRKGFDQALEIPVKSARPSWLKTRMTQSNQGVAANGSDGVVLFMLNLASVPKKAAACAPLGRG